MRIWPGEAGLALAATFLLVAACSHEHRAGPPVLRWYVFNEPSGAFAEAVERCSRASAGRYRIASAALPADADQQREQIVRRLAAGDPDIDVIGMDVIWTAELARAGWILPWEGEAALRVTEGRLPAAVKSASYQGRLWAAPFTSNTQLLWYRKDRVEKAPSTWEDMIAAAEKLGEVGTIQVQGERYEGLAVFFISLLASAGGSILDETGERAALPEEPTRKALEVMRKLARSPTADPSLSTTREDEARLAFETGHSSFMVNYTFVWPSARKHAPEIARNMGWGRWPAVVEGKPSRVAVGGLNLGVSAHSRNAALAFEAAACIASAENQLVAAEKGGLLPTSEALYESPRIRKTFPFAEVILATLKDAVQRPQTPVYSDISMAISRTLHPMRAIDPDASAARLRHRIDRALHSRELL